MHACLSHRKLLHHVSAWCVVKVLSIGETVMEVNDSGFSGTVETLRIQLLVDDSMLQVAFPHWHRNHDLSLSQSSLS